MAKKSESEVKEVAGIENAKVVLSPVGIINGQETFEGKRLITKTAHEKGVLTATASFNITENFEVVEYTEGDMFVIPKGWKRDSDFEEFRKINKQKNDNGIAFSVPNPVLDEKGKLKYMDSKRVILPLKEA